MEFINILYVLIDAYWSEVGIKLLDAYAAFTCYQNDCTSLLVKKKLDMNALKSKFEEDELPRKYSKFPKAPGDSIRLLGMMLGMKFAKLNNCLLYFQ